MAIEKAPRDVVVVSLEAWDNVWRRNQHLVDGLLGHDPDMRVLFVEPPRDSLHDLLTGRGFSRGRGARVHAGHDGRLVLFQPTKLLPRVVGGASDRLWRRQVLREISRLGMRRPLVWVNDAQGAEIVRSRDWPALYDITDDWLLARRPARALRRFARNEKILFERCREVVVCSAALATSRGAQRKVRLIPNAVDVARYRHPAPHPPDLPAGVALYAGTLHEDRLDVDLVARCAKHLAAEGDVVLVGPDALSATSRATLISAGVLLLGPRPHTEIPAYLQHADVLIVPHLVDSFTDSLDPIKLYEYRAVGRPVVSTAVAGFRDSAAPAVVVATADEFPTVVLSAIRKPGATVRDADVPDWSARVADMVAVLEAAWAADASRHASGR